MFCWQSTARYGNFRDFVDCYIGLYLSLGDKGLNSTLPTLGVIALSAQRLLPALQQVFSSWANISGNKSQLDTIDLLDQPYKWSN